MHVCELIGIIHYLFSFLCYAELCAMMNAGSFRVKKLEETFPENKNIIDHSRPETNSQNDSKCV